MLKHQHTFVIGSCSADSTFLSISSWEAEGLMVTEEEKATQSYNYMYISYYYMYISYNYMYISYNYMYISYNYMYISYNYMYTYISYNYMYISYNYKVYKL
jgi:hypothetical protein